MNEAAPTASAPAPETPAVVHAAPAPVIPTPAPEAQSPTSGAEVKGQAELALAAQSDSPPVAEAAPVEKPAAEPTLLGVEPKPADAPKEDAPPDDTQKVPDGEQPKDEASQSDEPAPLPSYEAWTLPEGLNPDTERLGQFNTMLGEFEKLTQADHAETAKFGQSLVDYHVAELKQATENLHQSYQVQWNKTKEGWKSSTVNDPEIGGARLETTVSAANEFISTHAGTAEQQTELRNLLNETGLGNHPAIIRMLANANLAKAEGKPLPAAKPAPVQQSKVAKRYGAI